MPTSNPVFNVLVTKGNLALLPAGQRPDTLAPGQLGVFSYATGLSLSAASNVADASEFYIAVGLGGSTLEDIKVNAGDVIQRQNVKAFSAKCATDDLPKIMDVTGIKADCDTDFALKIELRNNQIYLNHGYNAVTKTFNFRTSCCVEDCVDCEDGNCNELAVGLMKNINADADGIVIAQLIASSGLVTITAAATTAANATVTVAGTAIPVALASGDSATVVAGKIAAAINAASETYTASNVAGVVTVFGPNGTLTYTVGTTGATGTATAITTNVITEAGVPAYVAANPGGCLGLRLTSVPAKVAEYCTVNVAYYNPRGTDMIVSLVDGFACGAGTVTTIQELTYAEGLGYDIAQLEYEAAGWEGSPYVLSNTGIPSARRKANAVAETFYTQIDLSYMRFSEVGFDEHLNSLRTTLAIPCTDATTLASAQTVLNALLAGPTGKRIDPVITCTCPE